MIKQTSNRLWISLQSSNTGFNNRPESARSWWFSQKDPEGKNAKGKNFWKLRGRKKCSQKIFQKISQISLLLDFIVFLDIFEIFAEDCFLLRSFRKILPSGFLPLSRFQFSGELCAATALPTIWPAVRKVPVTPTLSELQTHPNLHSPVWVGSNGRRPQREGTNLGVFVPIWLVLPRCEATNLGVFVLCHFALISPYSNGAVQIRVGLELAETPSIFSERRPIRLTSLSAGNSLINLVRRCLAN